MMQIPVYVRTKTSNVRECVAIAHSIHGTDHYIVSELSPSMADCDGDTVPIERRYAAVHQLPDGNKYAEEVVGPAEYVEAVTHWRDAYRRMIVNDQRMSAPRGIVGISR